MIEQKVIDVINEMISLCKPCKYKDFNFVIPAIDKDTLRMAEKNTQEIGLANYNKEDEGISTLSIIATITDILVQKRLSFIVNNDGIITGVQWYTVE